MLPRLEVRVRKAEEDLAERSAGEEVGQEFHRVGADTGDVAVVVLSAAGVRGRLRAQRFDLGVHVFRDGGADFEAEDEGLRVFGGEGEEEAAEAAADVCDFDSLRHLGGLEMVWVD